MNKSLLIMILTVYPLFAQAAEPRDIHYFLWPAAEYQKNIQDQDASPSLCSLELTKSKKPDALAISKANRLSSKITKLLAEFVMIYGQGQKGLNVNLRGRIEKAKNAAVAMVEQYGFDFGRSQNITGRRLEQILNYDGYVPTEKELADLLSNTVQQADALLAAETISNADYQAWRWDLIVFQQLTATFLIIHPQSPLPDYPSDFWTKFSKIKSKI